MNITGGQANENVTVELGFPVEEVREVDLMENKTYGTVDTDGRKFKFSLGPFEIKIFLLL